MLFRKTPTSGPRGGTVAPLQSWQRRRRRNSAISRKWIRWWRSQGFVACDIFSKMSDGLFAICRHILSANFQVSQMAEGALRTWLSLIRTPIESTGWIFAQLYRLTWHHTCEIQPPCALVWSWYFSNISSIR